MASNFDLNCETDDWGAWEWLKHPIVDVTVQVENGIFMSPSHAVWDVSES